jgi:hypothetical protein
MSEFDDLIILFQKDPEAVKKILTDNPKLRQRVLELDDLSRAGKKVSVDGFKLAYKEFYGRELPKVDHAVAEEFVFAYHNKTGVIYESWRGKGKSTFFAAWCPYVMGVRPVGSTSLVRVNDQKAKEMGKVLSDLIMTNTGWRKIFGHVMPDERAGWSVENGFNVLDTKVTGVPGSAKFEENYAKWRMQCLADHLSEKSLICAGVESGSIIGQHPTNGMWFDDLHDESNTRSQAEMKKITDILEGNIIPTWFGAGGSPTLGCFCTPWSKNPPDAYQVMLKTGKFKHIRLPIFTEDVNGETIPTSYEDGKGDTVNVPAEYAGKKVKLAWAERFPMQKVLEMMTAFKTRFGQMALCDVELSKPKNMRYQEFPAKDIKWADWQMVVGVDPVATVRGISKGDGISHFAMGYALKTPYNSVVIGDGVVEKCDATEGERLLTEAQRTYQRTFQRASIESNGAGAIFIGLVSRNKNLRVNSHSTSEIGGGSKQDRQYRFLQPLFANGTVLVSDAHTPYLDGVREYLDNFPNMDQASYLWDIGDSLVLAIFDMPEVWSKVMVSLADPARFWAGQVRQPDPYANLVASRR